MNECWTPTQKPMPSGYVSCHFYNEGTKLLHRVFYETFNKAVGTDMVIDHLCRNRSCVNPKHLEEVTIKENILRGKGIAANNNRKTHCKEGHEFNNKNTYITFKNQRSCRVCHKLYMRVYKEKRIVSLKLK